MSTDDTITDLNANEILAFLASPIGQEMWDAVGYYNQQHFGRSIKVARCATNTWITIDEQVFCFRHWLSGVAGFTVQDGPDKDVLPYARVGESWVNLF